nr:hypothetical protein [Candidatus Freyarchaeota archaeon]
MLSYVDFESGYRVSSDENFDAMTAFLNGAFKIEASPEDALKMALLMPYRSKRM